uniref:Uncharacterized protein n=1 Tax=Cannabis sativa TaxID=3483 RepID=A0A803PSH2_CANSA
MEGLDEKRGPGVVTEVRDWTVECAVLDVSKPSKLPNHCDDVDQLSSIASTSTSIPRLDGSTSAIGVLASPAAI